MKVAMRMSLLAIVVVAFVSICSVASAQPGRGGRGGGGFFGGGNSNGLDLLGDENVRRELDLVDDQVTKLRDIQTRIGEDVRAVFQDSGIDFRSLGDLTPEEREAKFAPIREKAQKVAEDAQKDIDQVLLPQQRQRLKEIVVQSQIRRQGTSGALTSGTLATELNITEDQKEKLRAKQEEVEQELQKEMEQLRLEAREKILSVLTAEQRAKLNSLMGQPIQFQQFGGFGGFGGGRGPGGPGGPGGGNRGPNNNGGRIQRAPDGD
jgi:Spy/CpxP family protein refolding chaperone